MIVSMPAATCAMMATPSASPLTTAVAMLMAFCIIDAPVWPPMKASPSRFSRSHRMRAATMSGRIDSDPSLKPWTMLADSSLHLLAMYAAMPPAAIRGIASRANAAAAIRIMGTRIRPNLAMDPKALPSEVKRPSELDTAPPPEKLLKNFEVAVAAFPIPEMPSLVAP